MSTFFTFAAGVIVGATIVVWELANERLIVNNNLDGTVTIHYPGFGRSKPKAD